MREIGSDTRDRHVATAITLSHRLEGECSLQDEILGSPRTSSPLVFTRFQHVTSCQQFAPFFLASRIATCLLKFEESEMRVAIILYIGAVSLIG